MDLFAQFTPRLQSLWESALRHEPTAYPFFTYTWHEQWYSRFGTDQTLVIMATADGSNILPLTITRGIAHFTGGEEIADYLDAIGLATVKAILWQEALPILKKHGAHTVSLRNIPATTPSLAFFRNLPEAVITEEDSTPILSLPDSFDAYLAALDRKDRHELRRKMKKFEAEHTSLTFSVRQTETINIDALVRLMHHDEDKTAFLSPAMTNFFTQLPAIAPDTLRQYMLTVEEKIIASTLAFETHDSLLLYNSGFDPQYPGAGWYIKVQTIRWAIEQKLALYNFLQGRERYKYDLGAKDSPVYHVTLPLR